MQVFGKISSTSSSLLSCTCFNARRNLLERNERRNFYRDWNRRESTCAMGRYGEVLLGRILVKMTKEFRESRTKLSSIFSCSLVLDNPLLSKCMMMYDLMRLNVNVAHLILSCAKPILPHSHYWPRNYPSWNDCSSLLRVRQSTYKTYKTHCYTAKHY